eukprot:UN03693
MRRMAIIPLPVFFSEPGILESGIWIPESGIQKFSSERATRNLSPKIFRFRVPGFRVTQKNNLGNARKRILETWVPGAIKDNAFPITYRDSGFFLVQLIREVFSQN